MDNSTLSVGYDIVLELANLAIDEFKIHYLSRNFTGLIQRYYYYVVDEYGGKETSYSLITPCLFNSVSMPLQSK